MGFLVAGIEIAFWAFIYSRTRRVWHTILGSLIASGLIAALRYSAVEDMAYRLGIPVQSFAEFFIKIAIGQAILALLGIGAYLLFRRFTR